MGSHLAGEFLLNAIDKFSWADAERRTSQTPRIGSAAGRRGIIRLISVWSVMRRDENSADKRWDNNRSKENLDWVLLQQKSILFDRIRIVSRWIRAANSLEKGWRGQRREMEYFITILYLTTINICTSIFRFTADVKRSWNLLLNYAVCRYTVVFFPPLYNM